VPRFHFFTPVQGPDCMPDCMPDWHADWYSESWRPLLICNYSCAGVLCTGWLQHDRLLPVDIDPYSYCDAAVHHRVATDV